MALTDITKDAVEASLVECKNFGTKEFLAKYGFAEAKQYWVVRNGEM